LNYTDPPNADLNGAVVLVTGGTGSFGKTFAKTVLENYDVRKLIIFSRDELKQFEMQQSAVFWPHLAKMRFFLGDVRDAVRLEFAFREVDYVIHAAALKHVPAAEYNPFECIKTNVHGAENVVNAAILTQVKRVIALSTDKAASPVNLYGASKLAADKIFSAAANIVGRSQVKFGVVRYGNVLGSRGSVVPVFRKMARENAEFIPITDNRMTRFLITLEQGVNFVLSCFSMIRQGGEMFVPKIPSIKITELASYVAPNIPQREIGIRPGEKLHELMIGEDDARLTLDCGDRYVLQPDLGRPPVQIPGSRRVADRFVYASNTNPQWLDRDGYCALAAGTQME
jgi:UDP-N-acetylglucosamine 4,6-dehydratase